MDAEWLLLGAAVTIVSGAATSTASAFEEGSPRSLMNAQVTLAPMAAPSKIPESVPAALDAIDVFGGGAPP
jgi:hypothetical protein